MRLSREGGAVRKAVEINPVFRPDCLIDFSPVFRVLESIDALKLPKLADLQGAATAVVAVMKGPMPEAIRGLAQAEPNSSILPCLVRALAAIRDLGNSGGALGFALASEQDEKYRGTCKELDNQCEALERAFFADHEVFEQLSSIDSKTLTLSEERDFLAMAIQRGKANGGSKSGELSQFASIQVNLQEAFKEYRGILEAALKDRVLVIPEGKRHLLDGLDKLSRGADEKPVMLTYGGDGSATIQVKYELFITVMTGANSSEMRRLYYEALQKLPPETIDKLETCARKILELRKVDANGCDFESYFQRALADNRVASNPEAVDLFLRSQYQQNLGSFREWFATVEDFARRSTKDPHLSLEAWDIDYWDARMKAQQSTVSVNTDAAMKATFTRLEELLGYRIEEVPWDTDDHLPNCQRFIVSDVSKGTDQVKKLGTLLIDMGSRTNKREYGFATLMRHPSGIDGEERIAFISMAVPSGGELNPYQYGVWLHELGHVLSYLTSRTELSVHTGADVSRYYIETFSYVFELMKTLPEWTDSILGDELGPVMRSACSVDILQRMKNTAYALFDLELHSQDPELIDSVAKLARVYGQMACPVGLPPSWIAGLTVFGERFFYEEGYAGKFATYILGELTALSLHEEIASLGSITSKAGQELFRRVLRDGASRTYQSAKTSM